MPMNFVDFDAAVRDSLHVEPLTPEQQHAARKIVCGAAVGQPNPAADAAMLLDMLGLGRRTKDGKGGCPVCGKPLALYAISPKNGLKGTCSRNCKAVLYPGEGPR
jgi:hypothetical protein